VDGKAKISVRDNGKGIEREALDRVFDLFIQLDPNPVNSQGGLGVGLALVRRIVELHGGRVHAFSEGIKRGAEFQVHIPLSALTPSAEADEPGAKADVPASLRVMVVDDNLDAADSLGLMLKELKLEVRTVYDGAMALRECESFQPHLVLLDIGMPKMSGYDVVRSIRMMKFCGNPTVVAVSGWGQESDKARARESGFDRHFTKPISETDLHVLLAEVAAKANAAALLGGTG
jgi:CheY-like chemotaxis protein